MSLKASDLTKYLDRTGLLSIPKSTIRPAVVVRDARSIFGRVELLVAPLSGIGEGWHELGRGVVLDGVKGDK